MRRCAIILVSLKFRCCGLTHPKGRNHGEGRSLFTVAAFPSDETKALSRVGRIIQQNSSQHLGGLQSAIYRVGYRVISYRVSYRVAEIIITIIGGFNVSFNG